MAKKKRRGSKARRRPRPSREHVQSNARKGGGGPSWFNLPEGVETWRPKEKGKYELDFLPYEVTDENHPDGVEPGNLWYKRRFVIHRNVGPENYSYVCPRSIGRKCPIHEERDRLLKRKDDVDAQLLKDLNGQLIVAFNIVDPDDEDKVALFVISSGTFWSYDKGAQGLAKELDEDESICSFWDTEAGKTVKVRFAENTFNGNKFLKATRFDFEDREDMDEDEVLGKTINLDECLNVLPYDKMKAIFLEAADVDEEEEDEKPKTKGRKKGKPLPKAEEPEEDDEDEDEGEEEDSDEDDDEDSDEDEESEEEDDEDSDDEEEEDEEEDDGDDEDDQEEDEEEEEEVAPPPKKKGKASKKVTKKAPKVTKKKTKTKAKTSKKTKGKGKKCPAGGTFGKDLDKFDECEDCAIWEACEAANGG